MSDWANTVRGAEFLDCIAPRIAAALEKHNELLEKQNALLKEQNEIFERQNLALDEQTSAIDDLYDMFNEQTAKVIGAIQDLEA